MQDWIQLITATGTILTTIVTCAFKILGAINQIHIAINSRMDELLQQTKKAATAEGRDQVRATYQAMQPQNHCPDGVCQPIPMGESPGAP